MTGCPSSALVYKSPAFKSGVGFKVFAAPCTVCIFEGVWIFGRQVEFGTVELYRQVHIRHIAEEYHGSRLQTLL